jgi:hypothetical protein
MNECPYKDKISFATGNNLLKWIDSEIILVQHASVPGAIYRANIIYVYFVDVLVDWIAERIGLITSYDNAIYYLYTTGIDISISSDGAIFKKHPTGLSQILIC